MVNTPNAALDDATRAGDMAIDTLTAGGDEQLRLLVAPAQPAGVLIVAESLEPLERTLA